LATIRLYERYAIATKVNVRSDLDGEERNAQH
jgi:hypothetical protein